MTGTSQVVLAVHGRVGRLIIDRPAQRNAMTQAMWQAMAEHLKTIRRKGLRAVLLSSSSEHFCAGADIAELSAQSSSPEDLRANALLVQSVQAELAALPIPSLAMIQGACVGGGVGLVAACDLRLATPDTRFALTPIRLGLHYSLADTSRVAQLIGLARTCEMLLTAGQIGAEQALSWGLLNRLVDDAQSLEGQAMQQAQDWVDASPAALACTKRVLGRLAADQIRNAADLQAEFLNAFNGPDFREGISAFLEKRKAQFADHQIPDEGAPGTLSNSSE